MPQPATAPVDVWTVSLDDATLHAILSPDECDRAARFRFDRDRVRWVRARSALRAILAEYRDTEPQAMEFRYGINGKPALEDGGLHFNLSHADEWAMIAVTSAAPVGIDIEKIRNDVDIAKLLRRIDEPASGGTTPELFGTWARREAKTKALGTPLMEVPSGDLRVIDLEAPAGYAAALALIGHHPQINSRIFHHI